MFSNNTLSNKKMVLERTIKVPMENLAQKCVSLWRGTPDLSEVLEQSFPWIAQCHALYAIDVSGEQLSATMSEDGLILADQGRSLARHPLMQGQLPYRGLVLSQAHIHKQSSQPCISAIQAVTCDEQLLGFLVADFHVRDLPTDMTGEDDNLAVKLSRWQQYRGDPAIRSTVFIQQRVSSSLDHNLTKVNNLLAHLIVAHGAFHVKVHYSSSRCTVWSLRDPYSYHIYSLEEILDPDFLQVYPRSQYPRKAIVDKVKVAEVFQQFQKLREGDETLYLRSGSLNIMNGLVGLTFSCDGSHYLRANDFLILDTEFWFGKKISA